MLQKNFHCVLLIAEPPYQYWTQPITSKFSHSHWLDVKIRVDFHQRFKWLRRANDKVHLFSINWSILKPVRRRIYIDQWSHIKILMLFIKNLARICSRIAGAVLRVIEWILPQSIFQLLIRKCKSSVLNRSEKNLSSSFKSTKPNWSDSNFSALRFSTWDCPNDCEFHIFDTLGRIHYEENLRSPFRLSTYYMWSYAVGKLRLARWWPFFLRDGLFGHLRISNSSLLSNVRVPVILDFIVCSAPEAFQLSKTICFQAACETW